MRAIPVVLCAAMLGGCAHFPGPGPAPGPAAGVDGVSCHEDATLGEPRVYIELDYASNVVVPPCTVDAGTTLTWRGPEGARAGFAIDFTGASPAGPGAPRHYESNDRSGRPRVSLVAGNEAGSYEYHYSVGGRVVDPVIIIRR